MHILAYFWNILAYFWNVVENLWNVVWIFLNIFAYSRNIFAYFWNIFAYFLNIFAYFCIFLNIFGVFQARIEDGSLGSDLDYAVRNPVDWTVRARQGQGSSRRIPSPLRAVPGLPSATVEQIKNVCEDISSTIWKRVFSLCLRIKAQTESGVSMSPSWSSTLVAAHPVCIVHILNILLILYILLILNIFLIFSNLHILHILSILHILHILHVWCIFYTWLVHILHSFLIS